MASRQLSPGLVLDIAHGFWRSKALCSACELGVFTLLARGPHAAAQLSARLRVPERSLTMLLNANAALGFLVKRGDRFTNAPAADRFLVKGRDGYLGDTVLHLARALVGRWALLTEAVKRGRPVRDLPARPRRETARDFTLAMHGRATFVGRQLAEYLDLKRHHRLLDLGGGSGAISAKLAERFPRLRATVLDLPEACRVARDLCRSSRAAARISFCSQSYFQKLPPGHDVALLSQILHSMDEAACRNLLRRVHQALVAPGLVVVVEFVLNDAKTGPEFPALFALNMLVNTPSGSAYSRAELVQWLQEAGFRKVRAKKLPGYATVFTGEKT